MNYVKSYNISLKNQRLQIYRAERISVCGKDSIFFSSRGQRFSSNCISKDRFRPKEYLERSSIIEQPGVREWVKSVRYILRIEYHYSFSRSKYFHFVHSVDLRIHLLLDNELNRKIDVTAMQFLLVQNRQQTHDWTLIGSGANGLDIQEW